MDEDEEIINPNQLTIFDIIEQENEK